MCRKITSETIRKITRPKLLRKLHRSFSTFRRQEHYPRPVFCIMSIVIVFSVAQLTFRSLGSQKEYLSEGREKVIAPLQFPALPTEAVTALGKVLQLQSTLNLLSKDSMSLADSLAIRSSLREMQKIDSLLQQKLK